MKARRAGAALAMLASTCTRGDSTRAEPEVGTKTRDTSLAMEPSHAARSEQRTVPFEWRPPEGDPEAYAMPESADRHQLVMTRGVEAGGRYPVVIAMHGQPKRGQNPRDYAFARKVIGVAADLVQRGEVRPLVLALPVFRYRGANWPAFDLVAFRAKIEELLREQGHEATGFYVIGHSGAAGCGGDGMNRAHRIEPAAVGFFDTCLGAGWRDEVRALARAHVPTLLIQSVETAGVVPRQPREYSATFDFGRIFEAVGLAPVPCTKHLPAAPLRSLDLRCAANAQGTTRGYVVDTGDGEPAHEAALPVAFAYFLREYLSARSSE